MAKTPARSHSGRSRFFVSGYKPGVIGKTACGHGSWRQLTSSATAQDASDETELSVLDISESIDELLTSYQDVLDRLNSSDFSILNWMAVLVAHRLFSIKNPVARRAKAFLIENFGINVNAYDLITGYRADDSYFDYAEAFLNNALTVEQLSCAMRLGRLGEHIVIKSKFVFSKIKLQRMYYTLHEADISTFADIADERIREHFKDTNLKRIRTAYGCTQAALAEQSGATLRSIQMYEQRRKDINKASAETLYRIAKTLGCTIEDLIEK